MAEGDDMAVNTTMSEIFEERQRNRPFLVEVLIRLVREKPMGTFGAIVVLLLFLTGIFAPLLAPFGYNDVDLAVRLSPPSLAHPLGTDDLGRDLLSRIVYGARVSMVVAIFGVALEMLIALLLGLVGGYVGGRVDMLLQRFVDAFMSFPPIFFYLTIMSIVGPGIPQVIAVLGIISGIRESRVVRSAVINIKSTCFVEAATVVGSRTSFILRRHIIPNILAPLIVIGTVGLGSMITNEATLSFLGFGVPPPAPSWGGMLSGPGRTYLLQAPSMLLWPGVTLGVVVYGINMLGDAMRDILDPRLRGGLGRYGGKAKGSLVSRLRQRVRTQVERMPPQKA